MSVANYFEYVLFMGKQDDGWKTNITEDTFKDLLCRMSKHEYKYFQRDYKEIWYGDVVYQNYHNDELRVFKLTPLKNEEKRNNVLQIAFQKQKLSLVNVPSTKNFDDMLSVKQLIFRITNRIYVNFVVKKDAQQYTTYNVYINYNHDANVDVKLAETQIEKVLNQLKL